MFVPFELIKKAQRVPSTCEREVEEASQNNSLIGQCYIDMHKLHI